MAQIEFFISVHLEKKMVLVYDCRKLVYTKPYGRINIDTVYGKRVMCVSLKNILTYTVFLKNYQRDIDWRSFYA